MPVYDKNINTLFIWSRKTYGKQTTQLNLHCNFKSSSGSLSIGQNAGRSNVAEVKGGSIPGWPARFTSDVVLRKPAVNYQTNRSSNLVPRLEMAVTKRSVFDTATRGSDLGIRQCKTYHFFFFFLIGGPPRVFSALHWTWTRSPSLYLCVFNSLNIYFAPKYVLFVNHTCFDLQIDITYFIRSNVTL